MQDLAHAFTCYSPNINDLVIIITAFLVIAQFFDSKHKDVCDEIEDKVNGKDFRKTLNITSGEQDQVVKSSLELFDTLLGKLDRHKRKSVHGFVIGFFILLIFCVGYILVCSFISCGWPEACSLNFLKWFYFGMSLLIFGTGLWLGLALKKMSDEAKAFRSGMENIFNNIPIVEAYIDARNKLNEKLPKKKK